MLDERGAVTTELVWDMVSTRCLQLSNRRLFDFDQQTRSWQNHQQLLARPHHVLVNILWIHLCVGVTNKQRSKIFTIIINYDYYSTSMVQWLIISHYAQHRG